jgi:[phosphatase 2A protein]-leucine-carboxy methyltransferase
MSSLKARRISTNQKLSSTLAKSSESFPGGPTVDLVGGKPKISKGGTQLETSTYALIPIDLRDCANDTSTLDIILPYVDTSIPTLVLAECVFCYMNPEESAQVLNWFAKKFEKVGGVIYEMCGLE